MLADQFLSAEPEEDRDLAELARRWRPSTSRVALSFTVAPRELLANRRLVEAMAPVFDLYPRLSIDSLSDETLGLLDLDFGASSALEAARFLGSLGVPLRLNYIFVRPGMTASSLADELRAIRKLAECTEHLSYYGKLLLTHDVFSGRLDVLPGSPVAAKGVPAHYEREFPAGVLPAVAAITEAVATLVDGGAAALGATGGAQGRQHPLEVAAGAGLKALLTGVPG